MSGAGGRTRIRCAIYTRKSSDEGLDQAFNSLDAQREACAAYILSQASEGWVALPDIYDDGGLSGGTLERPALKRLLAEVAVGRIDIIVVYKVDRLTRSLLDFSKLVEAFDKAGTSFVSVTQSFNTTTSMGRLTLNMLLSFAQFEREVTAERIRDKIAASKAKGMWMGGTPPLGYAADGRSLRIVEEHAALVRTIFARYLALRNVRLVAEDFAREGLLAPRRVTGGGRAYGGGPLSRGQIYKILSCPTYVGEVHHSGKIYPGLHEALIPRDTWDQARALLTSNLQGERDGSRAASPSLLAGKVVDEAGRPFATSHACKRAAGQPGGRTRYRYYVAQSSSADGTMRVPAVELEAAVRRRVAALFEDPIALVATAWLDVAPDQLGVFAARCATITGNLREERSRAKLARLIERVRVLDRRIEVHCSTAAIADALLVRCAADAPAEIALTSDVRLTRSGMAMRLVHDSGAVPGARANAAAIRLLLKARRWWTRLCQGNINISRLAIEEQVTPAYVTRVVRLAFLAPSVVEAILSGRTAADLDTATLVATGSVSISWREQEQKFLLAQMLADLK